MTSALYVYGLTAAPLSLPPDLAAVDAPDARIGSLEFEGVCALVSPIAATRLDPLRRHVIAHTRALEAALSAGDLLPMRFGMVVESRDRLASLLARHAAIIAANFQRIAGCIEIGLKVAWSRENVWTRIGAADPALAADCARLAKSDPNRAYFDRIGAGRRVAASLAQLAAAEAARLDALIAPFCTAMKPLAAPDDMTFAHRALLTPRAREPALYAAVRAFATGGIDAKYFAPVPPYNFVDLALAAEARGSEAA